MTIAMLAFGDTKSWGQYHAIGCSIVDSPFIASPVMTALLDLGEDRKP
jgi:hypothetical protein